MKELNNISELNITSSGVISGAPMLVDFTLDAIYVTSSSSFGRIPLQVIVPMMATIHPQCNKIEAMIIASHRGGDTAVGNIQLYSYTNSHEVAGSLNDLPNTGADFENFTGRLIDITALEGSALSTRIKKITGSGTVAIEAQQLLIRYMIT